MTQIVRSLIFGIILIMYSCDKNQRYITTTGTHYCYDNLYELEIVDSVEKRLTIKFVENSKKKDEIIHFQQINSFKFYELNNRKWILGGVGYENKIREELIVEDSLIVESIYEPVLINNSSFIDYSRMWDANHYGTLSLFVKAPNKRLKNYDNKEIWVHVAEFQSYNDILWQIEDNKIIAKQTNCIAQGSDQLKVLVNGDNQVFVEYTKEF